MDVLLLAQAIPDASQLADAKSIQQVLAWVIASLVSVIALLVIWHVRTLKEQKAEMAILMDKREKDHGKMMKLALKVQKALEAWAGIEDNLIEEDNA